MNLFDLNRIAGRIAIVYDRSYLLWALNNKCVSTLSDDVPLYYDDIGLKNRNIIIVRRSEKPHDRTIAIGVVSWN